jgi:Uncharacterized proteins of PilT N-term./Vapc superfamily
MIKILLDTNVAVYIFDRKLDIHKILDKSLSEPYSLNILDLCVNELKTIGRRDVAKFVGVLGVNELHSDLKNIGVDDAIVREASKRGYYIMSEDGGLLRMAGSVGIKTVTFNGYGVKIK